MKTVRIEMPVALADMFLQLGEAISDSLANAGCNDFCVKDTPQNRETVALIEAEYEDEDEDHDDADVSFHCGKILTQDRIVFAAIVKRFREPLE